MKNIERHYVIEVRITEVVSIPPTDHNLNDPRFRPGEKEKHELTHAFITGPSLELALNRADATLKLYLPSKEDEK